MANLESLFSQTKDSPLVTDESWDFTKSSKKDTNDFQDELKKLADDIRKSASDAEKKETENSDDMKIILDEIFKESSTTDFKTMMSNESRKAMYYARAENEFPTNESNNCDGCDLPPGLIIPGSPGNKKSKEKETSKSKTDAEYIVEALKDFTRITPEEQVVFDDLKKEGKRIINDIKGDTKGVFDGLRDQAVEVGADKVWKESKKNVRKSWNDLTSVFIPKSEEKSTSETKKNAPTARENNERLKKALDQVVLAYEITGPLRDEYIRRARKNLSDVQQKVTASSNERETEKSSRTTFHENLEKIVRDLLNENDKK